MSDLKDKSVAGKVKVMCSDCRNTFVRKGPYKKRDKCQLCMDGKDHEFILLEHIK